MDNSSYLETGFQIERATNISTNWTTTFTVGANIANYSDTDVTPGNTYYYRVRAFNDYFYSDWSDTVHPFLSPPNTFRLNVISPILYALSWDYSNPIYLSGFEIERKISGTDYSLLTTVGANITSYYDTTVSPGDVYYYRIRAFNSLINSAWADEVTPTMLTPSLKLTVISDNRIDLDWGNVWTDEEGVEIQRSINNTSTWVTIFTTDPDITIYSDTPVTPGDIYYYRIRAFNAVINSNYSAEKTPSLRPPFFLSIGVQNISLTQTDLTWFDFNRDGAGFKIERKNGKNGIYEQIGTAEKAVIYGYTSNYSDITPNGFAPNTVYYYRGKAFNPFIESGYYEPPSSPESFEGSTTVWGDWSIVAGTDHTIAIKADKTIWTWGYNQFSQLGLGDATSRNTPTQIGTQSDWSNVSAGWVHTIAIKTNGVIWSWGFSFAGQLGLGAIAQATTPAQMGTQSDWSSVKAGYSYTIALKTDKTLWSWGGNDVGQLGRSGDNTIPGQVGTQSDWKAISAGYNHILALKTTGYLWAWGKNDYGQLGLGDNTNRSTPTLIVIGQSDWSVIAAGGDLSVEHSIALKTDGTMWAWGRNNKGQLGLYWNWDDKNIPTQVGTLSDWIAISAGAQHTMGRKTDGSIWAWGRNDDGQLGNDDYGTDRNTPVPVGTQIDWQLITAGYNHTMGIKTNGLLWVWGMNNWGQLGLGDSGLIREIPTMLED
jgi:alpha-tubulin suppressor-like RCC1 family protein